MTPPPLRRRTTAATAALLLGLTLAACGDDSSDSDADDRSSDESPSATTESPEETEETEPVEPAGVPSEAELATALVTAADVPAGFAEGEPDDDEDNDTLEGTCLGEIGEFDDALGSEPDAKAETEFTAEDSEGQSVVSASISAYADAAPVADAFTTFVGTLQECTSISATDDDGVTFDLQIAYDDTVDIADADQQLRAEVTGTITGAGQTFELTDTFVVMLRDSFVSYVGTSQVGSTDFGVLDLNDPLAVQQAQRLADLVG